MAVSSSGHLHPPSRGDELELTVDSLAYGGNGVARRDGYVVFVAGGLPGDRVRAVVGKSKRAYAEARAIEILEPSPDRIPEVADHPGAPWQVLPYERQLEVKAEQVARRADAGSAASRASSRSRSCPALEQWRYRNKLEYSFGTGDGRRAGVRLPRARPLRPHPPDDRLQAGVRARQRAARAGARRGAAARASARGTGASSAASCATSSCARGGARGQFQVRLVTSPGKLDVDALIDAVPCDGPVLDPDRRASASRTQGGETALLSGGPQLHEKIGDLDFLISPEAFFQTNTEMAERLYGVAVEYAGLRGHERVYDLYCGIGTIGLTLASRAREVIGVELVEPAVADAIENARLNDVTNAAVLRGRHPARDARAGRADRQARPRGDRPAARRASRRRSCAGSSRPRRSGSSTSPATRRRWRPTPPSWSRPATCFKRVRPVDLFPQTPHIECVALLEAGPDGVANPDRD